MIEFIDNDSANLWDNVKNIMDEDAIEKLDFLIISSKMLGFKVNNQVCEFSLKTRGVLYVLRIEILLNDIDIVVLTTEFSQTEFLTSAMVKYGPIAGGVGKLKDSYYGNLQSALESFEQVILFETSS